MFEGANVLIAVTGLFLTVFAAVWSLAWWLSSQFTALRNLIYNEIKSLERNIFEKIEYHEKHDDARFTGVDSRLLSIRDDIWDIRVRNSAKDTMMESINSKLMKSSPMYKKMTDKDAEQDS